MDHRAPLGGDGGGGFRAEIILDYSLSFGIAILPGSLSFHSLYFPFLSVRSSLFSLLVQGLSFQVSFWGLGNGADLCMGSSRTCCSFYLRFGHRGSGLVTTSGQARPGTLLSPLYASVRKPLRLSNSGQLRV